jgi:sodium-dependent dicarboxylate transporter 2/3/5
MLAIVISAIILFISEAMPLAITALMIIFTMKYTGAVSWRVIQQTATSSTVYFMWAGFGIGAALENTNLAAILLRSLYRLGRGDSHKMISAVCWMAAIISIFVSDAAAQVVAIAVVMSVIKAIGNPEPGSSRFAGGMMMAVTVGALTGGMALPCSNSVNVAVMDLAEVVSGSPMTFLQWSVFGVPIMILFTAVSAWCLPRYFKPEALTVGQTTEIEKMFASIPKKLNKKDWSYIVITSIMMFFWIASNWVTSLDVATVAIGGMFLMMLPGIDLLSAKDYKRNMQPMVILIMLCMFPLAAGMGGTGAGKWMIDKIFVDSGGWGLGTMYIMATISACLVHLLIPQGSANGALSAAIITPVCIAAGIPAATAFMLVGVQAGTGFLFPIEGVWSQTFGFGYYRFEDCLKGCWPIQLAGMVMCVTLIPLLSMLFSAIGLI